MVETFFRDSLETVRLGGNNSTHSQVVVMPTEEDYNEVSKAMTNLYAYLFFEFFKRQPFGSNQEIVSAFSAMPPQFRFVVLKELCFNGHNTVDVMDKLPKAAIKAFGVDGALEWTESEKEKLEQIDSAYTSEDAKKSFKKYSELGPVGTVLYAQEIQNMSGNMYEYLMRMIPQLRALESVPEQFRYRTFEEAKKVYLEKAILTGDSEDVNEFNTLMKFIYEGRRQEETKSIETSIATIMNSLDDICAYCKSWSSDTDYSVEIARLLKIAKADIDGKLEGLL